MSPDHVNAIVESVLAVLEEDEPPDRDLALKVADADRKRLRAACLKLEEELSAALLSLQERGAPVQPRMSHPLPKWS